MTDLKNKYEILQKKYSLPSYESINKDFDIEDIEPKTTTLLQKIRIKMHEKIDYYAKMIQTMLQPDSSLSDLYEAHQIEDDEKNSAYSLFKKMMLIQRKSNLASLDNNEDENATFIKESFNEWNSMKPKIQVHIKRLIDAWSKETDIKEDLSYFG